MVKSRQSMWLSKRYFVLQTVSLSYDPGVDDMFRIAGKS